MAAPSPEISDETWLEAVFEYCRARGHVGAMPCQLMREVRTMERVLSGRKHLELLKSKLNPYTECGELMDLEFFKKQYAMRRIRMIDKYTHLPFVVCDESRVVTGEKRKSERDVEF